MSVKGLKVGSMTRTLQIETDGRYRLESRLAPTGLAALVSRTSVNEVSEGELLRPGVRPRRYWYRKSSRDGTRKSKPCSNGKTRGHALPIVAPYPRSMLRPMRSTSSPTSLR